jgi:hypothetical protein
MTASTDSRGHLYGMASPRVIRVSLVILLFAIAYAVVVFAIGVVPLNMFLRKMLGANIMPKIWQNAMIRLVERTAVAGIACWLALAISRRIRGRLTGKGMLAVGAAMSGALAGAVDVGLQKLWTPHLVKAAQAGLMWGAALSCAITAAVAIVVTLLFITRSTKLVPREG